MEGSPPNLLHPPAGCSFHPRCEFEMPICSTVEPNLETVESDHLAACWLYQDHPEKTEPAGVSHG